LGGGEGRKEAESNKGRGRTREALLRETPEEYHSKTPEVDPGPELLAA
jgi:hypothetical protein